MNKGSLMWQNGFEVIPAGESNLPIWDLAMGPMIIEDWKAVNVVSFKFQERINFI